VQRVQVRRYGVASTEADVDDVCALIGGVPDRLDNQADGTSTAVGRRHEPGDVVGRLHELDLPVAEARLERQQPRLVGDAREPEVVVGGLHDRARHVRAVADHVEDGRAGGEEGEVHTRQHLAHIEIGIHGVREREHVEAHPRPQPEVERGTDLGHAGVDDGNDDVGRAAAVDAPGQRHVDGVQVPLVAAEERVVRGSGLLRARQVVGMRVLHLGLRSEARRHLPGVGFVRRAHEQQVAHPVLIARGHVAAQDGEGEGPRDRPRSGTKLDERLSGHVIEVVAKRGGHGTQALGAPAESGRRSPGLLRAGHRLDREGCQQDDRGQHGGSHELRGTQHPAPSRRWPERHKARKWVRPRFHEVHSPTAHTSPHRSALDRGADGRVAVLVAHARFLSWAPGRWWHAPFSARTSTL
jgi:hypothetical protein